MCPSCRIFFEWFSYLCYTLMWYVYFKLNTCFHTLLLHACVANIVYYFGVYFLLLHIILLFSCSSLQLCTSQTRQSILSFFFCFLWFLCTSWGLFSAFPGICPNAWMIFRHFIIDYVLLQPKARCNYVYLLLDRQFILYLD